MGVLESPWKPKACECTGRQRRSPPDENDKHAIAFVPSHGVKSSGFFAGIDKLLAQHIAHLFIRDPLSLFKEKLHLDDANESDHFEVSRPPAALSAPSDLHLHLHRVLSICIFSFFSNIIWIVLPPFLNSNAVANLCDSSRFSLFPLMLGYR